MNITPEICNNNHPQSQSTETTTLKLPKIGTHIQHCSNLKLEFTIMESEFVGLESGRSTRLKSVQIRISAVNYTGCYIYRLVESGTQRLT